MKITPIGKLVIFLALLVAAFFSVRRFAPDLLDRLVPGAQVRASQVPSGANLPNVTPAANAGASAARPVTLPGTDPGCRELPEVRFLVWAWNAQMGMMFANGGPQATAGSLMCQQKVNLRLVREDDTGKMQEALVAFANDLKNGNPNPTKGAHFVAIMGDGAASFFKGVNDTLGRLGPDYTAKVVGVAGYSHGEDKLMGPAEWKSSPLASRGSLVAGVIRDGDWNIAQKWLGDNGLCNNPDEKTYDPGCMNWVAASDYVDAAEKYIANFCEERPVVSGGHKTGERRRVCVNGVVTWTPGDVSVAQKRGGLVSIVSTHEYSSQMPAVVIGIDKWMKDNRPAVEGMLAALMDGGDQVKSSAEALRRASEVSAKVYHEAGAGPEYWEKYYKGTVERDRQGIMVDLGGSSVNNLADTLLTFGLVPGSSNLVATTYKVFGDIASRQYPDLLPTYPPADQIIDTSYVQAIAARSAPQAPAETPHFTASAPVGRVVSSRSWHITFDTGKATFSGSAQADLEQLLRDLLVASATAVEVHGHTDNVGDPRKNMQLSEERAFAVKQWLERRSPVNFPEGRIRIFSHGQENPLAPNSTADGRAKNRRVDIVLGTT
ncbi:MAG TPA: OmpA family protein [Thermoanaerobaculia bacterium]|nr:OmpA family protein [Thermoanaerobaculia bacterium]